MGIPMEVVEVNGSLARCRAGGEERQVNLLLVGEGAVEAGSFVLVHLGSAVRTMSRAEAEAAWSLLEEMDALV